MLRHYPIACCVLLLVACGQDRDGSGTNSPDPADTAQAAAPPAPPPVPSAPAPAVQPASAPPAKDAQGCVAVQLPGHFTGEGLGKTYVPGPVTRLCDPPRIEAAPAANPPGPTATIPAAPPAAPVATPM